MVADRNYDSFWILAMARARGADFCVRMRCAQSRTTRREIVEFVRSGRKQQRVLLDPGAYMREVCGDDGLASEPVEVRLVRVELPSGEVEVLATSLLDVQEFSAEEISALYSQRWRIEEEIKHPSSRTPHGVQSSSCGHSFGATVQTLRKSNASSQNPRVE